MYVNTYTFFNAGNKYQGIRVRYNKSLLIFLKISEFLLCTHIQFTDL